MHISAAASVAILAFVTNAAAEASPQPYLAAMPGLSLMRRSTDGYKPEQSVCGKGNTCAEACGAGFAQCASSDKVAHCYNPAAQQNCCGDGSGNSCDAGYYCTHDTALQTWCCPQGMDLAACAAAYHVKGALESAVPKTTSHSTTSTTSTSTTSTTSSTSSTSTTPTSTVVPVTTKTKDVTTTVCASSSGHTTAWTGSNSTFSNPIPTQPTPVIPTTSINTQPSAVPTGSSGAAATGVSALLLVAAGFVALL